MPAVLSTMQALGSQAPRFSLSNVVNDESVGLDKFSNIPLLVMFICNHCPYVIHLIEPLSKLANNAQHNGFGVVAISSNDVQSYPQDGPKPMREFAIKHSFQFPYLYDDCLLYTSPSPRDLSTSRMPSSA